MYRFQTILVLTLAAVTVLVLDMAEFLGNSAIKSEADTSFIIFLMLISLGLLKSIPQRIVIFTLICCTALAFLYTSGVLNLSGNATQLVAFIIFSATAFTSFLIGQMERHRPLTLDSYILHLSIVSFVFLVALLSLSFAPAELHSLQMTSAEAMIVSLHLGASSMLAKLFDARFINRKESILSIILISAISFVLITVGIGFQAPSIETVYTTFGALLLVLAIIQILFWKWSLAGQILMTTNGVVAVLLGSIDVENFSLLICLILLLPAIAAVLSHDRHCKVELYLKKEHYLKELSKASKSIIAEIDLVKKEIAVIDWGKKTPRTKIAFEDALRDTSGSDIIDFLKILRKPKNESHQIRMMLSLMHDTVAEKRSELYNIKTLPSNESQSVVLIQSIQDTVQLENQLLHLETTLAKALLREEHLLALASHELRTPLSVIEMLMEELQSGTKWSDIEADFVRTVERLSRILDDLRLATSMDSSAPTSNPFTVAEITATLMNTFAATAKARGCTLELQHSENVPIWLVADHTRILAALSRVLHNAIIHAPQSKITVASFLSHSAKDDASLTWQISDTGPGIHPDRLEYLFKPFNGVSQTDNETTTGLGLYTARAAMRILGGDLQYDRSNGVTRFILTHPVRILDAQPLPAPLSTNTVSTMAKYPDKIALLVEDNQLVGEITVTRLSKLFGKVHWANSGNTGLDQYREHKPHIIFMDQLLPEMNGDQVTAEIRKTDKAVVIIGITASAMGSECELLEAAGANYALEKPLKIPQIELIADEFFDATSDGN